MLHLKNKKSEKKTAGHICDLSFEMVNSFS